MKDRPQFLPEFVTCITDTREQQPLCLSPLQSETDTLDCGDYSARHIEHIVRIERKGPGDLVSCVGRDRARFEDQMRRLKQFPVHAVVVDTSWQALEMGDWFGQVTSKQVIGSVLGWISGGMNFVFSGSHERSGRLVSRMLFIVARRNRHLILPHVEKAVS